MSNPEGFSEKEVEKIIQSHEEEPLEVGLDNPELAEILDEAGILPTADGNDDLLRAPTNDMTRDQTDRDYDGPEGQES